MHDRTERTDVVVIGGGLTGLAAAALLAGRGRRVTLVERASALGGRATTHAKGGFRFNVGPHALYRKGHATDVLGELGVPFTGNPPDVSGALAIVDGIAHALPGGFVSLLTTGLLGPAAKLETARLLAGIGRIDAAALDRTPVAEFLAGTIKQPAARSLLQALFRLSTYANDPARQSAGSAVAQLQLALRGNVVYLDGGWQTLVDGLRRVAESRGVRILAGSGVDAVEHDGAVQAVRLRDGTRLPCTAALIATAPSPARDLLRERPSAALDAWASAARPVRAACLDVGLSHLPRPRARFALGIDRPLYCSVHSASARLAPAGAATLNAARYLPADDPGDPKANERELEGLLDLVQPGWRTAVVERRFLPDMVVSNALVTAAGAGLGGRPGPAVPDVRRLYVAGDWVGADGQLADASLASARRAAALIVADEPAAAAA